MTIEFKVPELGENVESGGVVNVLVAVGDSITVDQSILELETDKAVIEVPSSVTGVVEEILVKEGDQISPGDVILTVSGDESDGQVTEAAPAEEVEEVEEPDTSEPTTPTTEAPEPEPEPAEPASEAEETPTLVEFKLPELGEKLYDIAPAAPSVRRFAREIGIDIHYVPGSGPGGRISIEDVKAWSRKLQTKMVRPAPAPAPATAAAQKPLPDFSKWGEIKRESMSGIRRATAQNVGYSWAMVPHVTQHDKADITDLEKLRKHYARKVEAAGGKLTITAILLKVVAAALKVFPKFNSSLDMEQLELIYKQYYHIGMAVDTPHGLLVPVIRDVDQKNLIELSVELGEVAEKARNRKTSLEEMRGGCFTISNLGGIGGTSFTPIVNTPEVAVLGVARGRTEPVWVDDKFEPRLMLPLSLSYDHRVIDGAEGARFIRWVAEALEQPFVLMLEG